MTTVNAMIKKLNKKFPGIDAVNTEEWDGREGGIWFRNTEDLDIYNAYWFEFDPKEKVYVMGVKKELHNFLKDHGWFAEPYDSGTLMAWQ